MKKYKKDIGAYIVIIIGAIMASFSVICILIPNGAIDYGTAGIAIIISEVFGFNLSLCTIILFLPFWFMGVRVLGIQFGAKSLLGAIVYTIGLTVFEKVPFELNTEHFIAVAFGGAILGIGLALILKFGGCIDGSEILANILINKISEKTGKNYGLTYALLIFNACVYMVAFLVLDQTTALMSLLVYVVATSVIANVTDHFEAIKKVTIITKEPEGVISDIRKELNKTCTIMDSYGLIAGENKTLVCYVTYFELQKIRGILLNHNCAFTTVSTIDEII